MRSRSRPAQRAQGGAQQRTDVGLVAGLVGDRVDGLVGLLGRPAEADQALLDLVAPVGPPAAGGAGRAGTGRGADPVAQLEDDPLRALLADARAPGSAS